MSRTINRTYIYYSHCCDWCKPITVDAYLHTDHNVFLKILHKKLTGNSCYLAHQYIISYHKYFKSYHSWSFSPVLSLSSHLSQCPTLPSRISLFTMW